MAILLALLVGIYFFSAVWGRGATSTTGASSDIASAGGTRRVIGDGRVEAIWNVPASAKGTVLALHGCSHSALDWFPRDESRCAQCRGLAQELKITNAALDAGYALLAVSSAGNCWSRDDVPRLALALDAYGAEHGASRRRPLYAFGASSGGSFAGVLPSLSDLPRRPDGLIVQIAGGPGGLGTDGLARYPPTVLSHMPRDESTASAVRRSLDELTAAGALVSEHRLERRALTPSFFEEESAGKITARESAGLFRALRDELGVLDAHDLLIRDPRSFDAGQIDALREWTPAWDSLVPDESDVREILNVAYAAHELSAQDFAKNLRWIVDASSA